MAVKYRLPCACGQSIEVDSSQSGLNVVCACGKQLEVPTHRGLTQLERVDSAPATTAGSIASGQASSNWGLRQGLQFLGSVMLIGAVGLLAFVWTRPHLDPIEFVLEHAEPARAIQEWGNLRSGIDTHETQIGQDLAKYLINKRTWLIFAYILAGTGALVFVVSFLAPARPKSP